MKWGGATTGVFRKSSSALSLRLYYYETTGTASFFPKYFFRTCSSNSSSTNVKPPPRMVISRNTSTSVGSWIYPIRVPTNPLMTVAHFSNLPEDQNQQQHSIDLRCMDEGIDSHTEKQHLAELGSRSTTSPEEFSLEVISWAEQYISNAIHSTRPPTPEKILCAIQILIRSCDLSTTKKHLDLVLRFLLYPTSTSATTAEEYPDNSTTATNVAIPLDLILQEISMIATNISTAPYYAETILEYMEKKCTGDDTSGFFMTPTVATYNSVIEAWKNSCFTPTSSATDQNSSSKNKPINVIVLRAQAIYDRMVARNIQPNNSTLTLLIHLWAASNRSDAAFRATGYLFTLQKEFFQQEQEISVSNNGAGKYSSIDSGDIREQKYDGEDNNSIPLQLHRNHDDTNVQRTFFISVKEYEAVLRAWAVSKRKASAKRSAMLLKKMTHLHTRGMLPFEPSIECYKAALTSWKACDGKDRYEAAEQAMKIISHMLERYDNQMEKQQQRELIHIDDQVLPPDSECFTIALSIMSHSSKRGMAEKSQYFLQRMEQLAATTFVCTTTPVKSPSWVNYTDVIKCFALSKDVDKSMNAEKVLLRMEQLHDEYGDSRVRPHVQSYIAAMSAHVNSNAPDKAKQSLFVLQHMDERYRANPNNPKPTTECYNTVLMACARPPKDAEISDKQDAFRIALSIMKVLIKTPTRSISNSNNPPSAILACNEETFELLLKCCAKLLPPDGSSDNKKREKTIRFIFRQASRNGCVNEKVLKELNAAAGKVLYQRLVGTEYTAGDAMELIPKSWSCELTTASKMKGVTNFQNAREEAKHSNGTSYVGPDTLLNRKNRMILQGGRLT